MSIIYVCDFCGKNDKEVEYMLADKGHKDFLCICSECIDLSSGMLNEIRASKDDADQDL